MSYSLPYLLLLLAYLGIAILEYTSILSKKSVRVVSALLFVLFWGFRGFIGSDWINYYEFYESYTWELGLNAFAEPGFTLLVGIFKSLDLKYDNLVLFFNILQVFLWDRVISRFSYSITLSYILLIAIFPICIIDLLRNFTSVLIVMCGMEYLLRNENNKFYISVLIALLFHTSAIFFILLPLLRNKLINKQVLIILLPITVLVYLFQINFYRIFIESIVDLFSGRLSVLAHQVVGNERAYGLSWGILEKYLIYILIIINYDRLKKYAPIIVNCAIVFLLINFLFSTSQSFINRFAILFGVPYIINYSYIMKSFRDRRLGLIFFLYLLSFIFLRTSFSYSNIIYEYSNTLVSQDNLIERYIKRNDYYDNRGF